MHANDMEGAGHDILGTECALKELEAVQDTWSGFLELIGGSLGSLHAT